MEIFIAKEQVGVDKISQTSRHGLSNNGNSKQSIIILSNFLIENTNKTL